MELCDQPIIASLIILQPDIFYTLLGNKNMYTVLVGKLHGKIIKIYIVELYEVLSVENGLLGSGVVCVLWLSFMVTMQTSSFQSIRQFQNIDYPWLLVECTILCTFSIDTDYLVIIYRVAIPVHRWPT